MTIESIELHHVGPFRRKVAIGPLKLGINVLAAPNETGKTTFLRAASRALFDKHTCKDDEIRSLQPAGSDLAPQIAVVFEHEGQRYRVEKRFLNNPESRIKMWNGGDWQLLADGDAADERVQKLLQSCVPGRGATKAAHWGMLGFLWARQGEASRWPAWDEDWEDGTGKAIRSRLARVEIDPTVDHLRSILWEHYTELFTPTGKAKARGELDQVEVEMRKVESDKEQVKRQRLELDSLQRKFSELGPRLVTLQDEAAAREKEATELRAQATAAELQLKEVEQRQGELQTAKEKLETVSADTEQLNKLGEKLKDAQAELVSANDTLTSGASNETSAKHRVVAAQQELDAATVRWRQLNEQRERAANLVKLKQSEKAWSDTEKLAKRAAGHAESVRKLRAQLEKLPNVTPAKLKKLQELSAGIREHETKLETIGLSVELKPDAAAKLTVSRDGKKETLSLKAGEAETLRAPQNLDLQLSGWGRLRIRAGAAELSQLQSQLAEDREAFREQLASVECASLNDAETAVAGRRDLLKEIETAEEKLGESLDDFESLEQLQSELAALERQTNALRETLSPTSAETKASLTELESDAERLKVALRKAVEAQSDADTELRKQQKAADSCSKTREQAERAKIKSAGDVTGFERQITTLKERYPQGLERAKADAQGAFVRAEARHDEAKKKLPPDADKLPERNKRAAAAYEQVRQDLDRRKSEFNQLEGALQSRGAEGLYSKQATLEEREAALRQQVLRLRDRGWAARLAHDLIEFRKQAATRAVLAPLEARLSSTFAELSREPGRRVFLDEQLQIAGIGASRDAMISFAHLSQGAKEQLLLCLRLAVAGEVGPSGHRLVVLDDVLVNTDGQRQQRVLDLLQGSADQLQLLILTCHPERYRGVGEAIEIRGE